jgi:hypothetical protein
VTPRRLVLAGWTLLALAWLVANPPFGGPDEASHYLRSLQVGRGHLITQARPGAARGETERQVAWNRQFTYAMHVPPGMAPHDYECWTSDRRADAGCLDGFRPPKRAFTTTAPVGNYQPLPYLLPGLATRAAHSPAGALRLARALNALLSLALLYIALRMAWSPDVGPISLLGLLVAVTPMAIFCASMLTGSGPEIAAGIAFAASALRLRRDESCARSFNVWAAVGATGAVLALSRTSGPIYLVLIALAVFALGGAGHAWRFLRGRAAIAVAAVTAIVAAVVLNRVWEHAHGAHAVTGFANLRAVLDDAVGEWWRASSELIGKFGYLEYRLPAIVYVVWFAAGFALIAVALRAARRRERLVLAAAVAAAALLPMLLWVYAIRQTGFGLQGRHVLPLLAVVPLIAGDLVREHAAELSERLRRGLVSAIPPAVAAVHLLAFYWAARRAAVGTDGPLVFTHSGWSPPLGWVVWLVVAGLGAALVAAASRGARASTSSGGRPSSSPDPSLPG